MTESFFMRARRLVETGVDTVVGAAERLSGTSLMRQAIRDVESASDEVRRDAAAALARRLRAIEQRRIDGERAARLHEEARFALTLGRDDLAQAAIEEKLALEQRALTAHAAETAAAEDERRSATTLAELAERQGRLEEELKAHEAVAKGLDDCAQPKVENRVARAEQAFARALSRTGDGITTVKTVGSAAVIGALRREQAVAAELANLRAGLEAAATPSKQATRGRKTQD